MTIGEVTIVPVGPIGWGVLVYFTWRLHSRGHGWLTIIPAVTLLFLGFTLRKPELLSDVIFWVSMGIIAWLIIVGNGGGGGGRKRRRPAQSRPEKKQIFDWSGAAVPA